MAKKLPKKKSPAYTWYPSDHAADELESSLPFDAYGLWRRLYDHAWDNDGLPVDPAAIFDLTCVRARVGSRQKFDQLWMRIEPLFPPDGDRRRNPGQEDHRKHQKTKSKKNTEAARIGWEKRKNERSADVIQTQCERIADAEPTQCGDASPSQCLSISVSSSVSEDQDQHLELEEQRAAPRRRALYARLTLADVRPHLHAAVFRLIESGAPYVDAAGEPDEHEIFAAVRDTVLPALRASHDNSAQLAWVIRAALAQYKRGLSYVDFVAKYRRSLARDLGYRGASGLAKGRRR